MMRYLIAFICFVSATALAEKPHIILVMADDLGYGETGYYGHPVLKTPHLDAMAANGLRLDRFYAGAPVCSPTRASVLTGRANDRTGVPSHGHALRRQEKTLAQALKRAGYATGHFGKWHLNGLRGPGVPVLDSDPYGPGKFGFERWLSVTNFFDMDPIMSRQGTFEEFRGDSSEIIVAEALKFIGEQAAAKKPSFSVIWYGTPHSPFRATEEDCAPFAQLDESSRQHYGEIVAMDRSIGALRAGLKRLAIAENTLVWFNSDNGGLSKIKPSTVGKLRGFKGSLYEGGLRVPAVIEWPAAIKPRVSSYPSCTMDIVPTIAEIIGLPDDAFVSPQDGLSLKPLFASELGGRSKPIAFRFQGKTALVDNDYKIVMASEKKRKKRKGSYELYNLADDPAESKNLVGGDNDRLESLRGILQAWEESVEASVAGKDYPEGTVTPGHPEPKFWTEEEKYQPFFEKWRLRPEYKSRLK